MANVNRNKLKYFIATHILFACTMESTICSFGLFKTIEVRAEQELPVQVTQEPNDTLECTLPTKYHINNRIKQVGAWQTNW